MPIWLLSALSGTRKLFLKAWEWFATDPWRLFVIVATVFAFLWYSADNRADRIAKELQALRDASEAVVEAGNAADAEARDVATQTKESIDATTKQAKDDADSSDDPLDAVSKRLRTKTTGGGN